MPEEFNVDNQNNKKEGYENGIQVDNFPITAKLLDKKLKDKKDNILKVLQEGNLRDIFESFLLSDTQNKRKCIEELLKCENDETKIKEVILKNLPKGYSYDVSSNEVVKTEKKEANDYIGATTMDQRTATADQNEATADQKEATAVNTGSETEKKQEKQDEYELMKEAIQVRNEILCSKYGNLEKNAEALYVSVRDQLEQNGTLNQLRASNHDEQFINNYILVQATLVELKSNPTSYEQSDISYFDKLVKNLDNACNIPDTNLNSFSSRNIAQTRTELFNDEIGNDSLRQAKQSNLESRDYSEMLPEMGNEEMFKKYGQFLKGDLRKSWDEYKGNYLGFVEKINSINAKRSRGEDLVPEEQSLLSLESAIKGIKETIDNDTKNMAEELCIISQIKGMYMCMGEGADFDLNKANEIKSENGILTLNGHIYGVDFAIRQDTNNPEAKLQTSKKIARDINDKNTFTIGGVNNFVDSNFILPSQKEIFDTISETVKSGVSLEDFDNPADYLQNLQSSIMGTMDEKYENTKYVHHYMQDQVKGEKVADSSLDLLRKINPNIKLTNSINLASNEQLYNFIKMLNFNIENSTDTEKDNLNKCIAKILEIVSAYRVTGGIPNSVELKYPSIIEDKLKNGTWLQNGNGDSKLGLVFDLLSYYNLKSEDTRTNKEGNDGVPSKMIISYLYQDLFEFQTKGKSRVADLYDNEKQEKQDKQDADDSLQLDDASIWPPVG